MIYTQAWWGKNIPAEVKAWMKTVQDIAVDYVLREFGASDNPRAASDKYRFMLAQENKNAVWLDTDIELLKSLDDLTDGVYMDYAHGRPHGRIIIVNGHCDFFCGLEKERIKRGISLETNAFHTKLVRDHVEEIKEIPSEYYIHHLYTTRRLKHDGRCGKNDK